eukprot:679739-Alexandrium_andersonii.AAC.1
MASAAEASDLPGGRASRWAGAAHAPKRAMRHVAQHLAACRQRGVCRGARACTPGHCGGIGGRWRDPAA